MSLFGVFPVRVFPHSDWISPYSVLMRENVGQKNSEYEHFLRSAIFCFLKDLFTYSYYQNKENFCNY